MSAPIPVYEVSDETAAADANEDRKREGAGRKPQADTADEDDRFQALAQYGDEWEHEHGVLLAPKLEAAARSRCLGAIFGLDGPGQLDTPLVLQLGHTEKRRAHDTDDDGSEEAKGTLPDVLSALPAIPAEAIEASD